MIKENKIFYSLNIGDIQTVAIDSLNRKLKADEIDKVVAEIEKSINWFDIIEEAISSTVEKKEN